MADTYIAVPLRAYSKEGCVVVPGKYKTTLEEAVSWIEFTFTHRECNGHHQFEAAIDNMRVLEDSTRRAHGERFPLGLSRSQAHHSGPLP